jgi:hypothetical protein
MRRCIGFVLFLSYLEISSLASWKTSIFRVCNPNLLLPPNDPTPIIWLLIQKKEGRQSLFLSASLERDRQAHAPSEGV